MVIRQLAAAIILVVSIAYLYTAVQQLNFGTLTAPQAGFMPIITGIILVALCCIRLLVLIISSAKTEKLQEVNVYKLIFLLVGIFFCLLTFNSIGYIAANFIFLFYMFKLGNMDGFLRPIVLAGSSTGVLYILFNYYFSIWLP